MPESERAVSWMVKLHSKPVPGSLRDVICPGRGRPIGQTGLRRRGRPAQWLGMSTSGMESDPTNPVEGTATRFRANGKARVPLPILASGHFCFQNASHSGPAAKAPNSTNGATCSTFQRAPVCFSLTFKSCLIEPSTSPLPIGWPRRSRRA